MGHIMSVQTNKNYLVYKHTFPNGKVYIGITKQKPNQRWRKGEGYKGSSSVFNAINKYGWDNIKHEILFVNLSREQAEQKEIELIDFYKSFDEKFGYNLEKGGSVNKKISLETRKKLHYSNSGKNNGMYGKHHKPETIEQFKKNSFGKNNAMYGKFGAEHPKYGKHLTSKQKENLSKIMNSKEVNEKIRNSLLGEKNPMYGKRLPEYILDKKRKKVLCIETGIVYKSIVEAREKTGFTGIGAVCNGRQQTSGNLHWKFVDVVAN